MEKKEINGNYIKTLLISFPVEVMYEAIKYAYTNGESCFIQEASDDTKKFDFSSILDLHASKQLFIIKGII